MVSGLPPPRALRTLLQQVWRGFTCTPAPPPCPLAAPAAGPLNVVTVDLIFTHSTPIGKRRLAWPDFLKVGACERARAHIRARTDTHAHSTRVTHAHADSFMLRASSGTQAMDMAGEESRLEVADFIAILAGQIQPSKAFYAPKVRPSVRAVQSRAGARAGQRQQPWGCCSGL